MPDSSKAVAIIGAGPAGLCVAIALHKQGILCEVYESRKEPSQNIRNYNGALYIMANGAKTLDKLDVYENLRARGVIQPTSALRNADNTIRSFTNDSADRKAGFPRCRIGRRDLHLGLHEEVIKRKIPVHLDKAFRRIVAERNASDLVSFELDNGETREARLLIGADGIYSKVRQHLAPEIEPEFTGTTVLGALVDKSKLQYPDLSEEPQEYHLPTFLYGDPGVYALIPQGSDEDGADMLIFTQHYTDKGSDAWQSLRADKTQIVATMRLYRDYWPDPARSAIDHIDDSKLLCWPIHTLPNLPFLISETKNVILIGDAAHAVDPASAQGVNQAFEDGYALALLLKFGFDRPEQMDRALEHWSYIRRKRLDLVAELARINQNMRKPAHEREPSDEDRMFKVREDLVTYDCDRDIREWIKTQN